MTQKTAMNYWKKLLHVTAGRESTSQLLFMLNNYVPRCHYCHVQNVAMQIHTWTHTRLTALCPELPGSAGTRKVQSIWILLNQETVGGSGIRWAICKSAPRSRQITMPAPHCSVFYRLDALPVAQPTASKHWSTANTLFIN